MDNLVAFAVLVAGDTVVVVGKDTLLCRLALQSVEGDEEPAARHKSPVELIALELSRNYSQHWLERRHVAALVVVADDVGPAVDLLW